MWTIFKADWTERGLTSPPTQGRRFLQVKRSNQQYQIQSTEGKPLQRKTQKKQQTTVKYTYTYKIHVVHDKEIHI